MASNYDLYLTSYIKTRSGYGVSLNQNEEHDTEQLASIAFGIDDAHDENAPLGKKELEIQMSKLLQED